LDHEQQRLGSLYDLTQASNDKREDVPRATSEARLSMMAHYDGSISCTQKTYAKISATVLIASLTKVSGSMLASEN
jgi:hypothetical protein